MPGRNGLAFRERMRDDRKHWGHNENIPGCDSKVSQSAPSCSMLELSTVRGNVELSVMACVESRIVRS